MTGRIRDEKRYAIGNVIVYTDFPKHSGRVSLNDSETVHVVRMQKSECFQNNNKNVSLVK